MEKITNLCLKLPLFLIQGLVHPIIFIPIFFIVLRFNHLLSWKRFSSMLCVAAGQANVMDYFSERSNPFYERTCNNEILKMQKLGVADVQLQNMQVGHKLGCNQCCGSGSESGFPDPYVYGLPGSGSISQRYGSGFGSFYHQAKKVKKKPDSYCFVTSF
jgi:hypothetical protein